MIDQFEGDGYTHMNRGITTGKRIDTADYSDEERQPLRREFSQVEELRKDLFGTSVIGHVSQGDENREEAKDVEDQDHALKSRQELSSNTVDGDTKQHDCPK
jgi:hypothetical protein